MVTGDLSAGVGEKSSLVMDEHPIQGGVAIFLVASCYRNRSLAPAWWTSLLVSRLDLLSISHQISFANII